MADQQDGATATDEKPPATDGGDGGEVSEQNLHPKLGSNPSLAKLPLEENFGATCGRLLTLLILQFAVAALFALVYTEMGFGATVFKTLAKHHALYDYSLWVTLGLFLFLYLFDFRFWAPGAATFIVAGACGLAVAMSAIFVFKAKPYAPVAILYVGTPMLFSLFNKKVFKNTHLYNFMTTLASVLIVTGFVAASVTLVWASQGETGFGTVKGSGFWWGADCKAEFRARLRICKMTNCTEYQRLKADGVEAKDMPAEALSCPEGDSGLKCKCPPEDEDEVESACTVWSVPDEDDDDSIREYNEHCLAAFMLWACPFIFCMISLVFGLVCTLLARTVKEVSLDVDAIHPGNKIFIWAMLFGILGIYTAASIAGASMEAADLVTTFAMLTVGICVVTLGASIGWSAMESQLESIPIVQKLQSAGHSDYLKAVGVLVCGFPSIFYFILAFFNQTFRRTLPCTKDVRGDESHLLVTQLAHNQIDAFKHWNWTSVFSKVVWVGFFYFVFAVGVGKFTNLGLSALNQYLGSKDLWFVSLMYFIVGFIMFMLPPVPGIPVYLTGGIVMATAAAKSFGDGDTENFAAGVLYASFMACFIKSCAIVGQMTIIGGKMGKLVSVRRAVGVNSITIRAIKRILSQPGLPMNKIFILVGGPDWPTSVLTGILGCDILQMLLGSTPFLITISVTVLAGAMLLKAGESASMGAAASAMLFIASLVQSGALLAALIAIEDVARQHKAELEAEPDDEEVLEADELEKHRSDTYERCTHWTVLPSWVKGLLLAEAGLMYASLVLFVGASSSCFEQVEVTTVIKLEPLYGDVMALVKPAGRIGFGLHFCAVFLHQMVFSKWAAEEVKNAISKDALTLKKQNMSMGNSGAETVENPATMADLALTANAVTV